MNNQDKGLFVKVDTVMPDMEISKPMAYKFIAEWNEELKEMGYVTLAGRVPRAYYETRLYEADKTAEI